MIKARREGFALAASILAMLIVGAIVTGGFYAAAQEGQVSGSLIRSDEAIYVAETGLLASMAQASAPTLSAMPNNTSFTGPTTNVTVGTTVVGNYRVRVTRVNDALFVFSSSGTVTKGGRYAGATHTIANMTRLRVAFFDDQAALVVFGNVNVGGTADVDGTDTFPLAWAGQGCTLDATSAAVVANTGSTVTTSGAGNITGPVTHQPLTADDFNVFGDLTWNDLVAMREKTVSGTVGPDPVIGAGATCNTAVLTNWGSSLPAHPCFNYFPIIYAPGDLLISSSSEGQGILLVEGDLDISGGFNFYGIAIVKGEIRMTGTGGHVNGTTLVYGGGDISSLSASLGTSLLQYSSCAVRRAMINNSNLARVIPIAHRSWMDVSAIQGGN